MNDTAEKILDTDAFGGFDIRALPEYAHSIGTGYQSIFVHLARNLPRDYPTILLKIMATYCYAPLNAAGQHGGQCAATQSEETKQT